MMLRRAMSIGKKEIVVVVPIYKEKLNPTEQLSLKQLFSVLSDYDVVFVAPRRLEKKCQSHGYVAIFFDDKYFSSTSTYSQLLLSDSFYERFEKYEYMLIYQLDAFVFRDELLEFCKLGYDYIGAPIARHSTAWKKINARVGNGGLSLRKIASVRKVVGRIKEICNNADLEALFYKYEDLFFGYCGIREDVEFRVPDIHTALKFAVDDEVSHVYRTMNSNNLPFGCHGWSRYAMYPLWRPYIADSEKKRKALDSYYKDKNGFSYRYLQWEIITPYIVSRFKLYRLEKMREIFSMHFARTKTYTIWGYGKYGVILHKLLKEFGYEVVKILDVRPKNNNIDETPVVIPNVGELIKMDSIVVIAATDYDTVIKEDITSQGVSAKQIILFREVLEEMISYYVNNLFGKMK